MAESRLYINRQFNRQILKDIGAKLNNGYNIFVILSYDEARGNSETSPSQNNFIMDDLDYVYNNSEIKYIVKTDKTENLLVATEDFSTDDIVTFKGRTYYTSTFDDIGDNKFNHLYLAPEVEASYEIQPEEAIEPLYYNTTTILLSNITADETYYDYTLNDPDEINLNEEGIDTIILAQARHANKVLPKYDSEYPLTKDEKTLYMMLKI